MKVAIVNKSDLSIASWYDADQPNQGAYGGPWGSPEMYVHVGLESGDQRVMKATLNEDDEIVLESDLALEEIAAAADMEALRQERNRRLSACDWTQMADSPLSEENKITWAIYRQALRDLPANNANVTSLDEVQFPSKPE
jgi:hypothetical protein